MGFIGEEISALGEAFPEIVCSFGFLGFISPTIDAYKQGSIFAIPFTLLEAGTAYFLYRGLLRGDLFNRWAGYKYSDPLKTLYNKVKSKV
jgi:hypothetical protein